MGRIPEQKWNFDGPGSDDRENMSFIRDITPALKDSRYVRIDDRPLLLIYPPELSLISKEQYKMEKILPGKQDLQSLSCDGTDIN